MEEEETSIDISLKREKENIWQEKKREMKNIEEIEW